MFKRSGAGAAARRIFSICHWLEIRIYYSFSRSPQILLFVDKSTAQNLWPNAQNILAHFGVASCDDSKAIFCI